MTVPAEDLAHFGWQAAVCAPLPGEAGAAAGALLLAWHEPRTFYVFGAVEARPAWRG